MLTPGPGDTHADTAANCARAYDSTLPLQFVQHYTDDDLYMRGGRGGTAFLIMGLWTGMPPDLLAAVRARRAASVTGRCPVCDAAVEVGTGTMVHGRRCPVTNERLCPPFARWLRRVGPARGRRIREAPDGKES